MKNKNKEKKVPEPIGPYSQSILIEKFLLISGQIPNQIDSKKIPEDISQQTKIILKKIKIILKKSNFDIKDIIKINIYITNIKEINKVNKIYKSFFTKNFVTNFPTRSCVEVSALPQNSKIEIEAMAYKK
ncbi:2-iminobutanoate/2-iminopropanoate deaminase [Buchnera aphidicola (Tetraneura ulmi)]|uniref:Rid family detoxifying hydrolase n=1 Tax=Buchnera aphidicola TaxID=9 RepID=UPI003464A4B0